MAGMNEKDWETFLCLEIVGLIVPGPGAILGLLFLVWKLNPAVAQATGNGISRTAKAGVRLTKRERKPQPVIPQARAAATPAAATPAVATNEELINQAEDRLNRKLEFWQNAPSLSDRQRRRKLQDAHEAYEEEIQRIADQA